MILSRARSLSHAARLLGVSVRKLSQFARIYKYDEQQTYYDYFSSLKTRNRPSSGFRDSFTYCQQVLTGEKPNTTGDLDRFKQDLINHGFIEQRCSCCGYNERRSTDYQSPLILRFIDEDSRNGLLENIQFVCYNCWFLSKGSTTKLNNLLKSQSIGNESELPVVKLVPMQEIDANILENMKRLGLLD